MADLRSRHVVKLHRPAKPVLVLADLTGKPLKTLGLNNDISAGNDYTRPIALPSTSILRVHYPRRTVPLASRFFESRFHDRSELGNES